MTTRTVFNVEVGSRDMTLVTYFCIIYYYKLKGLEQFTLLSHSFDGSGVEAWFNWVLYSASHRLHNLVVCQAAYMVAGRF